MRCGGPLAPRPAGRALLACVALAFASGPATAVELGAIVQQSPLGQPLRVVIPVILAPGEELPADCIKLASGEHDADGIPQLLPARVELERAPSRTQLVVTDARPVNDPVVRLTIQAGCDLAVRHEYTLLMDPPPIEAPVVAAESATRDEVPARAPPAATGRSSARVAAAGAPRTGTAAARKPAKSASTKPRTGAKAAPARPPRAKAGQPRLTVSSAPPPAGAIGGATATADARQAQSQQDLANAIEAETVVLQQRIAELTAMVDRMQQEVQAGERAQRAAEAAARRAADEAAKQASLGRKAARWLDANGAVLAAIVGLPLLIAAGLLWKRGRDAARYADRLAARRATGGALPNVEGRPVPMLRNPPAGVLDPAAGIAPARRGAATPATPPASPLLEATQRARARKPMPPAPAAATRPPQRPLAFELDFDGDVRKTGKKPST